MPVRLIFLYWINTYGVLIQCVILNTVWKGLSSFVFNVLGVKIVHWQGMLLSAPADAIEIVCHILRIEVYLQAVSPLWIAIVTEDVILFRGRYFRSLVICTYGQTLRLVLCILWSSHRWGTDFLLWLIGEFSEFSFSCNHVFLFYHKYMVGTERM